MSSRIRSDFGTLGERLQAMNTPPKPPPGGRVSKVALPAHAWARFDDAWRPAVLLRWVHHDNGTWSGEVATVDDTGSAALYLIASSCLRPCPLPPPDEPM